LRSDPTLWGRRAEKGGKEGRCGKGKKRDTKKKRNSQRRREMEFQGKRQFACEDGVGGRAPPSEGRESRRSAGRQQGRHEQRSRERKKKGSWGMERKLAPEEPGQKLQKSEVFVGAGKQVRGDASTEGKKGEKKGKKSEEGP